MSDNENDLSKEPTEPMLQSGGQHPIVDRTPSVGCRPGPGDRVHAYGAKVPQTRPGGHFED